MLRYRNLLKDQIKDEISLLCSILKNARPRNRLMDSPGLIDLQEILQDENVQDTTQIWMNTQGKPTAFTLVDPYNNLIVESINPDDLKYLFPKAVLSGTESLRKRTKEKTQIPNLDISCRSSDSKRLALIKQEGFIAETYQFIILTRDLDDEIPHPLLPMGFSIRTMGGLSELKEYVALHKAAFRTDQMTLEMRKAIMDTSDYDKDLDLVIVSPKGNLVAFCVCQIFKEENEITGEQNGWADPIGIHPDYQSRGLGLAVLLAGLHKLQERGIRQAVIGTTTTNTKMLGLAKKAGFLESYTRLWFTKSIQ